MPPRQTTFDDGRGWWNESRRHSEAAKKGRGDLPPAQPSKPKVHVTVTKIELLPSHHEIKVGDMISCGYGEDQKVLGFTNDSQPIVGYTIGEGIAGFVHAQDGRPPIPMIAPCKDITKVNGEWVVDEKHPYRQSEELRQILDTDPEIRDQVHWVQGYKLGLKSDWSYIDQEGLDPQEEFNRAIQEARDNTYPSSREGEKAGEIESFKRWMATRPTQGRADIRQNRGPYLHEGKPNVLTRPRPKPLSPEAKKSYDEAREFFNGKIEPDRVEHYWFSAWEQIDSHRGKQKAGSESSRGWALGLLDETLEEAKRQGWQIEER